jgi:hypothetical protein
MGKIIRSIFHLTLFACPGVSSAEGVAYDLRMPYLLLGDVEAKAVTIDFVSNGFTLYCAASV